jgi:methylenetetrahydrofolate dehydrogenase (NADP+)/methenyltetrahydrofolate cyclohydrolase
LSAHILDGKAFALDLRARVGARVASLRTEAAIAPGLAVILVGDDPASAIYVNAKGVAARDVGFTAFDIRHSADVGEQTLIDEIGALNADPAVHGILVQMPLPAGLDAVRIIAAIDPLKDVDGLTAPNVGRLASGEYGLAHGLVACTPSGCLMLIRSALNGALAGKEALVIGRSSLVGKPMAHLLLQDDCTVTMAHSKTRDLPALARRADILVAAIGRAEIVRGDWIKPGAVVIDVGMNRKTLASGKTKLVGDVAFDEAASIAGAITPVPGGVGPMTNACLMRNTLIAACLQTGLKQPEI